MVRKRYTYYFYEFVMHKYAPHERSLRFLFRNMTAEEKLEIASGDFHKLWFKLWRFEPTSEAMKRQYHYAQRSYENVKARFPLLHLLNTTGAAGSIWELPKGKRRVKEKERPLNAAIRETFEETGITSLQYRLTGDIVTVTHEENNVKYNNTFYAAFTTLDLCGNALVNYSGEQTSEILELKWVTLPEIKLIDHRNRYYESCRQLFKQLKLYEYSSVQSINAGFVQPRNTINCTESKTNKTNRQRSAICADS